MASKSTNIKSRKGAPIDDNTSININDATNEVPDPPELIGITWIPLTWADLLNVDHIPKEYLKLHTNNLIKSIHKSKQNALGILAQGFGDLAILTLAMGIDGDTPSP